MIANHLSDTYISGRLLLPAASLPALHFLATLPAAEPDKLEVQAGLLRFEYQNQYYIQPTRADVTLGTLENPFYGLHTTGIATQAASTIDPPPYMPVFLTDPTQGVGAVIAALTWAKFLELVGTQGPPGEDGEDGAPGEKWFTSALGGGTPPGATGIVGDWYLDSTTGNYWEKTAGATWTYRGNLMGPQGLKGDKGDKGDPGDPGAPGSRGEQWFTGAGAPNFATGLTGDWYLDSTSGDYYEKTAITTWTYRGNLMGPVGPKGEKGDKGDTGDDGTRGEEWFTSALNGGEPPSGTGLVGDWYLDASTGNYFDKDSSTHWTYRGNLKGVKGDDGGPGGPGPAGAPGEKWFTSTGNPTDQNTPGSIQGDWYLNKDTGDYWEKTGTTVGSWVNRGNLKGPKGTDGNPGAAGEKWFTQVGVPAAGTGAVGDWSLDSATGNYYEKTTGTPAWVMRGNLKGPKGDQGADAPGPPLPTTPTLNSSWVLVWSGSPAKWDWKQLVGSTATGVIVTP